MHKYKEIFILILFFSLETFPQPLIVNFSGGICNPFNQSEIKYFNGTTSSNSGSSNLIEFNIDYGKKVFFIEPYIGIGYKFQFFTINNPMLSEFGDYIDIGIKKTFEVGQADFRLFGGIGYQRDDYVIDYLENNIKHTIEVNGLKYQLGLQVNFKFINHLDALFSWQYSIRDLKAENGSLNRLDYEFSYGGNYQSFYFGFSLDVLNTL